MKSKLSAFLLSTIVCFPAISLFGERPPEGSQPLPHLLQTVEEQTSGTLTEAEFDDGHLEVRVAGERSEKVYLDPRSGEIVRRKEVKSDETPPTGSLPLSEIARIVEEREKAKITEIEFDDGVWEIELHDGSREIELNVDPATGERRK